jgi:hypothetical protein
MRSDELELEAGLSIRITLMRIRIRIQVFTLMRILLLIKVMEICDHWSVNPTGLHFDPPVLHCERLRPHGSILILSEASEF